MSMLCDVCGAVRECGREYDGEYDAIYTFSEIEIAETSDSSVGDDSEVFHVCWGCLSEYDGPGPSALCFIVKSAIAAMKARRAEKARER